MFCEKKSKNDTGRSLKDNYRSHKFWFNDDGVSSKNNAPKKEAVQNISKGRFGTLGAVWLMEWSRYLDPKL